MAAATALDIKNNLLTRSQCLGNTGIGFKEVCSQLIDDEIKRGGKLQRIADTTCLSTKTVERMWRLREAESGSPYRPSSDTIERVLKSYGGQVYFDQVKIKPRYSNKPKIDER